MARPDTVPAEFDVITVVLLRRPANPPVLSDEDAEALQGAHLAYRKQLADDGYIVANGPFITQTDPTIRGMSIFTVGPARAKELSDHDPSVLAGVLENVAGGWCTGPDVVAFPQHNGEPAAERITYEEMLRRW